MMTDLQRGLTRLRNNPTDALLLMADSVSEGLSEGIKSSALEKNVECGDARRFGAKPAGLAEDA